MFRLTSGWNGGNPAQRFFHQTRASNKTIAPKRKKQQVRRPISTHFSQAAMLD
jgi:hypothetical protein